MLPPVKEEIPIELKGYKFIFRRMTWKESLSNTKKFSKLEVMATALHSVAGTPMNYEDAFKVLKSLPIPIQERLYIIYMGSQDDRRLLTAPIPWSAPEAVEFKAELEREEAQKDEMLSDVEESFAKQFGKQALKDEMELSREIIRNSGYKGAVLKEKSELNNDGWSDE
jgi:hypothetical protein